MFVRLQVGIVDGQSAVSFLQGEGVVYVNYILFGIIKETMGFRRFSLLGEQKVAGEWMLVCSAYNIKRMFSLINI